MTTATSIVPAQREPELVGQIVVVIGGSAGIGLETARRARGEGAEVILVARNADRLKQAALELGAQATAALDATDTASLQEFFHNLPAPIDHVLVTGPGPHYGSLLEMNSDDVRHALGDHVALALGRPQRRTEDEIRRNNTSDGRHPSPAGQPRARDRASGHSRATSIHGRARA